MAATKGMKVQESGADVVERDVFRQISIADSDETVLKLNQIPEVKLEWDFKAFRKLSDGVVKELRADNLKRYVLAEAKAEEESKKAVRVTNPFNPIKGNAEFREFIRPRKGWHQAWKNPGREFDEAMAGPYKQVRKPTKEQEKAGFEPGEETGEVWKRLDGKGEAEAIAVECPQELFDQYLKWMASKSDEAYRGVKENYYNAIEDINRKVTRRGARITPMEFDNED